jgi:hypothetical protein
LYNVSVDDAGKKDASNVRLKRRELERDSVIGVLGSHEVSFKEC